MIYMMCDKRAGRLCMAIYGYWVLLSQLREPTSMVGVVMGDQYDRDILLLLFEL